MKFLSFGFYFRGVFFRFLEFVGEGGLVSGFLKCFSGDFVVWVGGDLLVLMEFFLWEF